MTCLVVLMVAYFLWSQRKALGQLAIDDPTYLVAAVVLLVAYFLLYNKRYQTLLVGVTGIRVSFGVLYELMVHTRFLNQVVPQSGNAYRGVRLKTDIGIRYTDYVSSAALFAWLDTITNLLIATAVIFAVDSGLKLSGVSVLPAIIALSAALIVAPFILAHLARMLVQSGVATARWPNLIASFDKSISGIRRFVAYPGAVTRFVVLSVLLFATMGSIFWLLFKSIGVQLSVSELALFYALYRMTILVTVTPGNIGVREFAYGALAGGLGVGALVGVVTTLVLRCLTAVVLAISYLIFQFLSIRRPDQTTR